jgi:hypothetical protein
MQRLYHIAQAGIIGRDIALIQIIGFALVWNERESLVWLARTLIRRNHLE